MTASENKGQATNNVKAIFRSTGYTLVIYLAINLIAFGWGLLFHDFDNGFSIQLKYLSFSIDEEVQGITWRNDLTKLLLLGIFLAFLFREFRTGRASLRPPESK